MIKNCPIPCFVSILALLLVSETVLAQAVRGYSEPGRLGYYEETSKADPSKVVCTADFEEPSDDGILSEGEEGTVVITVRNYHERLSIQPKLEIMMHAGSNVAPVFKIERLGMIAPGRMVQFKEAIPWHMHLPPGSVTFRVKVLDSKSKIKSSPVQVRFRVQGPGIPVDRRELQWNPKKRPAPVQGPGSK